MVEHWSDKPAMKVRTLLLLPSYVDHRTFFPPKPITKDPIRVMPIIGMDFRLELYIDKGIRLRYATKENTWPCDGIDSYGAWARWDGTVLTNRD